MTDDPSPSEPPAKSVVRLRSDEELKELALDCVQGRKLVTNDEHIVKAAFYMMLAFVSLEKEDAENIGALIGDYNEVVPGRAMNGYPIFCSIGFLHKDDREKFNEILKKISEALNNV